MTAARRPPLGRFLQRHLPLAEPGRSDGDATPVTNAWDLPSIALRRGDCARPRLHSRGTDPASDPAPRPRRRGGSVPQAPGRGAQAANRPRLPSRSDGGQTPDAGRSPLPPASAGAGPPPARASGPRHIPRPACRPSGELGPGSKRSREELSGGGPQPPAVHFPTEIVSEVDFLFPKLPAMDEESSYKYLNI